MRIQSILKGILSNSCISYQEGTANIPVIVVILVIVNDIRNDVYYNIL